MSNGQIYPVVYFHVFAGDNLGANAGYGYAYMLRIINSTVEVPAGEMSHMVVILSIAYCSSPG